MRIFADLGVPRQNADCLQAKQRRFAGAKGRHQSHHTLYAGRLDDGAERLMEFIASERSECFFHDVDAFVHGKKLFDFGVTKDQEAHGALKISFPIDLIVFSLSHWERVG